MTGAVSWEQLLFIFGAAGTIIGVLIAAFKTVLNQQKQMHDQNMTAFKATVTEQQKLKNDLQAGYDNRILRLDTRIEGESRRIDEIEIFNAGLRIIMKSIDEFKIDVKKEFDEVTRDRKEEIGKIDKKLDLIIGDQMKRRTDEREAQA